MSEELEPLWEDAGCVLSRRIGSSQLVLAPTSAQPSPATVGALERAFALRSELEETWALRPRELVRSGGSPALVFDDPGGEILAHRTGEPWQIEPFLGIAIGLAVAVRRLHERGLVHKDIKPGNLFVDLAKAEVRLAGFGIAARIGSETKAPAEIVGSLEYMAPEQTGRVNRQVDARSDLYAVGVTLYELLAGTLPFAATTPLEWIHSHVARPVPALAATVPEQVANIVTKLLAKASDDRYQSASGLEADLRRCLTDLRVYGRIELRPLGTHDSSAKLIIAERLYGRGEASKRLRAAFDNVAAGATELVLVSGYSGIGKSSLVDQLHRSLTASRVRLARGKFDQYKRDIPYATLAEALQSLTRQILGESEADVGRWRQSLLEAVGSNGQLITQLVPELELLIGAQPPLPEVSVEEAKHRFQLLVQRVLSVFARQEHPLVLFLDDLQWVDRATLELLRYLIDTGARHMLLIGAYRDNEVPPSHPLLRTIEEIRSSGASVQSIVLGALPATEVGRFLADVLNDAPARVAPLAQLVHDKTGGNPFFVIQFILALRDDGLLDFHDATSQWNWELGRILARGFTDNLADFMVAKIARLSRGTRDVLKQFACLGRIANANALATLTGQTEVELAISLHEAIHAGLVVRADATYAFPHDRVQEASYALSNDIERTRIHLRIARTLTELEPARRDELIFEIANHYNRAAPLVTPFEERRQVAEIDFGAAKRAMSAIAFESAATYLAAGLDILGNDAWDRVPELAFELTLQRGNCEYLTGELASATLRLEALSRRRISRADQCTVACLRASVHLHLNEPARSIAVCLDQLRVFGIDWQPQPSDEIVRAEYDLLVSRLHDTPPERLTDLPLMTDPDWIACMEVLLAIEPAAIFSDKALHDLGVIRMANLSIEHGNCPASALGYAELQMVLWPRFRELELGLRFSKAGRDLVEREGMSRFSGRVLNVAAFHELPWSGTLSSAQALMRRALAIAIETGDLTFRSYSIVHLAVLDLALGDPLDQVQRDAEAALAFARKTGFELIVHCMLGILTVIDGLRGVTPGTIVDEAAYDEPGGLAIAAFFYWVRQTQAKVYAGDFPAAVRAYGRAKQLLWMGETFFEEAEFHYYGALANAGGGHRDAIAPHLELLTAWAKTAPETFDGRVALVSAELARLDERVVEAEQFYEQAIDAMRASGLVCEEALAHELAARFYEERGLRTSARAFRASARACYERWGAFGKVRQLDRAHHGLAPASQLGMQSRQLDASTVLEMSKAVSSEIVIERLLERLMALAVEHAGAVRGLLIAPTRNGHRMEAEALAEPNGVRVRVGHAPVSTNDLPESILHYVVRTQQIVNLEDATRPNPYATDPYLTANRSRSVLCLPIVRHAELAAVLYLENSFTSHAFTPDRVAILRVLASQAAISLENARLYAEIRRTQLYLDRAQALSQTGSFGWGIDTGEVFWSDEAFKIYGYDRTITPTAEYVLSRVHPDDAARVATQVADAMRVDADWISEFRLLMPDGTIKHAHVAAKSAIGDDGTREYIGAVMDVTAAKRTEEQVRRAEQAEALQLANESLERAKEEAEAANRAKDDFLANVSHEIRTPMNAVLGMTELVLETEVTDEQRQWLRTVKSAADNLLVIIDDLLDFSKIEAGKLELHPSDFRLRTELDDTTRALALRAERKRLALRTTVADDVPDELVGDVGRLRQVLINLLGNAVKFTEYGEIVLDIALKAVEPDEVVLAFAVRDTGIGIPGDKQAVIFQAFTQQDTSTTRTYGGTGLGLTIAVRLVAMMGGEIGVVSEPGRGSTFTFTARFAYSTKATNLPAAADAATPLPATSLRVLIAEDNEFNAQLIRQLLYRRGHQARVARDGEEALALLDQGAYDLLLLDLHMPGIDGFEVIARVRERERGTQRHLPVIALTARSRREDRERCFAAGMDDFLPKPIHASSLWTMVDRIAEAVAPAPRLLDPDVLLAACDGNAEILSRVVAGLRAQLPYELGDAHACFDAGDAKGLREKAHRLQGMISTASTVVAMVASELEDEAANNRLDTSAALLARLEVLTTTLLTSLEGLSIDDLLAARHADHRAQ